MAAAVQEMRQALGGSPPKPSVDDSSADEEDSPSAVDDYEDYDDEDDYDDESLPVDDEDESLPDEDPGPPYIGEKYVSLSSPLYKPLLPGPYIIIRRVKKSLCAYNNSSEWRMNWAKGWLYDTWPDAQRAFSSLIPAPLLRPEGMYYRLESLWGETAYRRGLTLHGRSPLAPHPHAHWRGMRSLTASQRIALSLAPIYPVARDVFHSALAAAGIKKIKWGAIWDLWLRKKIILPVGKLFIINDTDPAELDLTPVYGRMTLTVTPRMDWLR
jgi:hypothetical protein